MIEIILNIALILIGYLSSYYLFYKFPKLDLGFKVSLDEKITIIIPARNEEKTIGLLLSDLMSQTLKNIEIIVVDDGSSDKTSSIIDQFPVKKITVKKEEKPSDYFGKSWAVEYGSSFATNDLLLFLDSDVRLKSNAVEVLINQYLKTDKTITVQPYHTTNAFYEQFSMPFNLISLAANNTSTKLGDSIGLFGPVILINKDTYIKIGKHSLVKSSIIEDVNLGIILRKKGFDFLGFIGLGFINYKMYPDGYKSLYQGWTKNIAYGAQKSSFKLKILIFSFVASLLSVSLNLFIFILNYNLWLIIFTVIFYMLWIIRLSKLAKLVGYFKWFTFVFFPLIIYHFLFIFIVSFLKKIFKIPVKWKDRSIVERKTK